MTKNIQQNVLSEFVLNDSWVLSRKKPWIISTRKNILLKKLLNWSFFFQPIQSKWSTSKFSDLSLIVSRTTVLKKIDILFLTIIIQSNLKDVSLYQQGIKENGPIRFFAKYRLGPFRFIPDLFSRWPSKKRFRLFIDF